MMRAALLAITIPISLLAAAVGAADLDQSHYPHARYPLPDLAGFSCSDVRTMVMRYGEAGTIKIGRGFGLSDEQINIVRMTCLPRK